MNIFYLNFFFLIAISGMTCTSSSRSIQGDTFCSSFCYCDMWYKLRRATCTSRHLFSIQTGVSNTVQALDLSDNSIAKLLNYDLKNTGLVNLKYLNLSDNSINEIGSFAFAGLGDLTVIDLSRNHLYYVLWDTFIDSNNLRILRLDGNRFGTRVPDLHSNVISELGLSSCQISHINTQAFAGLRQLKKLDLSNNFMIQIDPREFQSLPLLRELNLDNNPWSCSSMKEVQSYLEDRKIKFNAPCVTQIISKNVINKFEKIIDASTMDVKKKLHETKIELNNNNNNNNWVTDPPSTKLTTKEICLNKNESLLSNNGLLDVLTNVSTIWILTVGFILGFVTSMLFTYVWLTGVFCFCKCPKLSNTSGRNRSIISDNNSQRISLLNPTCPGTPPPPYRDVVLHSSAYPSAPEFN